jgi:hypothetical protein
MDTFCHVFLLTIIRRSAAAAAMATGDHPTDMLTVTRYVGVECGAVMIRYG